MMEEITVYLILALCFFLLFIGVFLLFGRYKKNIQVFWAKRSWLWKIPWDPTIKIICLWEGILFAWKLIYYVPCHGIIQTTSSIWWVDTCVLTGLCFIFFLFLALPLLIIFAFLLFSFALFTGDGRVVILHKLETAQSRKAFENLVEAAHSIKDNHYKSSVLRVTAMAIAQHGNTSWATAIAKGIPDMRIRTIALKLIQQGVEAK